jgi:hypothetical protein
VVTSTRATGGELMQVIQNADGRLELFARGVNRDLIHIFQTAPNNGWSDWESLGVPHPEAVSPDTILGTLVTAPIVGRNADGRLEVFAIGSKDVFQNDLVHIWQTVPNGPWSQWASLEGRLRLTAPAVGQNGDGRLEVFACADDASLWHIWQTAPSNGWSDWAPLEGALLGAPVVSSNADGRLGLFARGTDNQLWHMWQTAPNNGWSEWAPMGRGIDAIPSVALNADGRQEVFVNSGFWLAHIWQSAPSGPWSGWDAGLSVLADYEAPGVCRNADGRLEIVGGDFNGVMHQWQTAPSNGWSYGESLGGQTSGTPIIGQNADGRLEIFMRGLDRGVYTKWQTAPNNGWSDWLRLGDAVISDLGRTIIDESGVIWGLD